MDIDLIDPDGVFSLKPFNGTEAIMNEGQGNLESQHLNCFFKFLPFKVLILERFHNLTLFFQSFEVSGLHVCVAV